MLLRLWFCELPGSPLRVVTSEIGTDERTADRQSLGLFSGRIVPSADCVGCVALHSTKRAAKGVARPSAKRVTFSGADGAATLWEYSVCCQLSCWTCCYC